MEEIGATNPEYQPMRVLWRRLCAHARKTIPLAPIQLFTRQIVQTTSFHQNNYYARIGARRFFFLCLFYFHRTLFSWACVTPGNFYLKYSFSTYTYLLYNSLISSWIPTKFVSVLLLCMLYNTNNFQHKENTSIYLRGTFTLLVDSFHNLDPPANCLNKLSDTQSTLICQCFLKV